MWVMFRMAPAAFRCTLGSEERASCRRGLKAPCSTTLRLLTSAVEKMILTLESIVAKVPCIPEETPMFDWESQGISGHKFYHRSKSEQDYFRSTSNQLPAGADTTM